MQRILFVLVLLVGCGGRAEEQEREPTEPSSEAGAATTSGGSGQGGERASGDGGEGSRPNGEGAAGAQPEGGAASGAAGATAVDDPPLIGSGSRYCENELYCFGLACYAPEHLYDRVCVSECEATKDCAANEVCLQSPDLRGTCYRRCDYVSDCLYGFDCFDFTQSQEQLVCFPTRWAEYWRANEL
jgi:hypothetical protein